MCEIFQILILFVVALHSFSFHKLFDMLKTIKILNFICGISLCCLMASQFPIELVSFCLQFFFFCLYKNKVHSIN